LKVLAYASPGRGHVYPLIGIVAELVSRGDRCVACTLASELDHVRRVGAVGRAIDPRLELEDWHARSPRSAIRAGLATFGERARLEGPDLERALAENDPDLLLIDINCWGAAAAAESSGRPWAIYCPYLLPFLPSRDAPPYGPGLAPLRGPAGILRDAFARRFITADFERIALSGVNAARALYRLPVLTRFSELLARPPLVLGLTAEGFEYPRRDWPANVRLVGPVMWTPPALPSPEVDALRGPVVLVTCSTKRQDDRRLIGVALHALPGAGLSVIATTAAHDPDFVSPPGAHVARFISYDAVLDRAVCVVCHGGMGVTQRALAAGVPVVAVPFGRDQFETARRVEVARAGVRLPARRLNGKRLIGAVRTAMARRDGAMRVARAYSGTGGAHAAADALHVLTESAYPLAGAAYSRRRGDTR